MRIVIDLQGAQGDSRFRGIGRYSLDLALGIARNRGDHEVIIALSDLFPDTIDDIRSSFLGILPSSAFRVWDAPGPISWVNQENGERRKRAEMIRETFLAALEPDVVLVASLFEGFGDDVATSIGLMGNIPTSVILYDLIPLIRAETLGQHKQQPGWYADKIKQIKRADQLLAISASSSSEATEHLDWNIEDVTNISTAANPMFKQLVVSEQETKKLMTRYGLTRKFLMCAAGMDPNKNLHTLIKAFSQLEQRTIDTHQLAVVCRMASDHKDKLAEFVTATGLDPDSVVITDYVPDDELVQLYNICTAFIVPSVHEGFGLPALEAMQCGKAVIASNTTSLPEVLGREDALFDPRDPRAIAGKIEEVLNNHEFRRELEIHGREQAQKFSWDLTAQKAIAALEKLLAQKSSSESHRVNSGAMTISETETPIPAQPCVVTDENLALSSEEGLSPEVLGEKLRVIIDNACSPPKDCIQKLLNVLGSGPMPKCEMLSLAEKLSRNFPPETRKRTLFVDVSILAQFDAKTGIQRVVRAVLSSLLKASNERYSIVPVRRNPTGQYVVALGATEAVLGVDFGSMAETPVEPTVGDIFVGLDLDGLCPQEAYVELDRMKRWGAKIFYVVYDLLPLQFPAYFDEGAQYWYPTWIDRVCTYDGAICISKAVADDLNARITDVKPERKTPFQVSWFHLGADVQNSNPSRGLPEDADLVLARLKARPTFLMVGTVEPRKGYRQVISAFEQLWRKGVDANLVIVGKEGWNVVDLAKEVRLHSEKGTRFFWLENASDEYLERIYGASNCLIAASEGEGFGLPLIEAAQHKLPILARDIPVFKEVAGKHASYFSGREPRDFSKALERWLHAWYANRHIPSDNMPWLTWDQSAAQLISIVDQWSNHGHKIEL